MSDEIQTDRTRCRRQTGQTRQSPGKEAKKASLRVCRRQREKRPFSLLPYVAFIKEGNDKEPTIQFSGANVQELSGAGTERGAVNGEGNLVVGYDEQPGIQTG